MMLSVILSTQMSLRSSRSRSSTADRRETGAHGLGRIRGWLDARRQNQARREVVARHTKKGQPQPVADKPAPAARRPVLPAPASRRRGPAAAAA